MRVYVRRRSHARLRAPLNVINYTHLSSNFANMHQTYGVVV
jgi:hypothetical protein